MKKQSLLIIVTLFLTSLTTYGEYAEGEEFITSTNGESTSLARFEVTSVSPKTVTLIDYVGDNGVVRKDVSIPSSVLQGYSITHIGNSAFRNKGLTSMTISNNVQRLNKGVFKSNKLTNVEIPQGVTFIGNSAFPQNNLTSVTIPGNVETIDLWAFADNSNLVTVVSKRTDPSSIQANTFENLNQIDVVVPKGALGNYVSDWGGPDFNSITEEVANGDNFTIDGIEYQVTARGSTNTVTIVDYIGSATRVNILGTVTYQGTDFEVTIIGERAFRNKGLTSVEIPESVTIMEEGAFDKNALTSVRIPENITRIEKWVFAANDLREVTIPANVEHIGFPGLYPQP